jgi:hypothetical protein
MAKDNTMNATTTRTDNFTNTGWHTAQAIVSAIAAHGIKARIGTTYLDYGQNWKWETVLVGGEDNSYQALNPRQFKAMNDGTFDYSEVNEIVATAKRLVK